MPDVRIIEVKESVFADNDRKAAELRARNKERGTFLLNLMSSPGSGKTTTLKRTIEALDGRLSIAVMEADIDSDVDARHLDAYMTAEGLEALENEAGAPIDLAILENVGNLVCPAEFDTGASANVMILSVPEGDDKPLKYPLMFSICDVVLINKIDALPAFDDFSLERAVENIHMRNPEALVIPISAKTGEGIDAWAAWLHDAVAAWKSGA